MQGYEIANGFGFENLRRVERPDPKPGAGQVVVKVKAASLNYRDLLVVKGAYNPKMPLPRVPLSDAAGVVEAVGPGVTRVKVGQRVAGIFMQSWLDGAVDEAKGRSALGGAIDGVLAEYVVFDENGLVTVPDHLSNEEAATLPCAAVTAWHALVTEGGVTAGDSVLIQGTGGVSLFALQFARLLGARVLGTSSSDAKLDRAKALGLSEGINYKTTPEWGEAIRKLSGGGGVDHVVEVGGAGTMPQSLRAVRLSGRVSLIGVLSGASQFNPMPILMKNVRVQGIFVGSRAMFEAMNRAIALHKMRPVIDRVFPFAEAAAALKHLESGAHFGKVVIAL
jgi:NADPH:quinone reductase-like Zn-dependent oxidoreductase